MENQTEQIKSVSASAIIMWVLGVLIIIIGLTGGYFFVVLAGIIILPILNTLSRKYLKINFSSWARILIAIILIILSIIINSSVEDAQEKIETSSTSKTDVQTVKQEPTTDFKVTAVALNNEYKTNGVSADNKYKDKLVEVTGTIESIDRDILNNPYVALGTGQYSLERVQCLFSRDSESSITNLSLGQKVTVKGTVSGKIIINIVLDDCVVI